MADAEKSSWISEIVEEELLQEAVERAERRAEGSGASTTEAETLAARVDQVRSFRMLEGLN